jgi:predicted ester cyclase
VGDKENFMTSKIEIVKSYAEAAAKDMELAFDYLSDDFHTIDKEGNVVLTKEGFSNMGRMMLASFPDYVWITTDIRKEGDYVILSGHNEGTHRSDLDLSAMGLGVVRASRKKIVWPESIMKLSVEGGKIIQMEPYGGAAGLQGFLEALGIELPSE